MSEKTSEEINYSAFSVAILAEKRKKLLSLRQIRDFTEQLLSLPDGAPMPDWSEMTIGDRFTIVRRLLTPNYLRELMGKSVERRMQRYEAGQDIPLTVVAALAAETEIPLDWIVSGRAMDRRPPLVYISPDQPQADPEDAPIQKLAFKAAAGRGELILDDLASYVRFPRGILAQLGVTVPNARLMEAAGDSMRNTINDGDLLLVDVSEAAKQIVEGKIFVFGLGNEAYVKRLRRTGDRITMISDNREMFPPEEVPADMPVRIFGRVKWSGRSH